MTADAFLLTASLHSIIPLASIVKNRIALNKGLKSILNKSVKQNMTLSGATATPIFKTPAIAAVLDIKDPYTREHAWRVAKYASRLAGRIGLNATDVEGIRLGGLLHDIGKIGLSAKVLNNTHDRLSDDMLAEVRLHPLMGAAVLRDFDIPAAVIEFVQYHHEQIDGSGYPFGLKKDQIPLGAKIIRIADCFDAITTDRPYQQRKSWIEALAILRQISGTDLDPDLLEAFIIDIKEKGLASDPTYSISLFSPMFSR